MLNRTPARRLYACALVFAGLQALAVLAADAEHGDAQPRAAEQARLASRSLLIDIAPAGKRLIAVGERGHILLSDDQAQSWRQAERVPVQALLTGVCFVDAKHGIAVGHDEAILTTADAGNTWKLAHYAPEKQQPLLDVWCGEGGHAIAVGAYSAYYETSDGGQSWSSRALDAKPLIAPAKAEGDTRSSRYDEELPPDYHFNRIGAASPSRLYIAGEAGHLYRSDDAGASWVELPSPYEGSFFGALPLSADDVLVYGLRGNVYRSTDGGSTWARIKTHTTAMLNDAVRLRNGGIAMVGLSGVMLLSWDAGLTFSLIEQADRKGLSATLPVAGDRLAVVGESGARVIALNPGSRGE